MMRKQHFKLLSLILALAVLLQPFASYASEKNGETSRYTKHLNLIQDGALLQVQTGKADMTSSHTLRSVRAGNDTTNVRDTLYSGLYWTAESIDVSKYKLTLQEFQAVLQDLLNTSPELFYVGSDYSVQTAGNYVLTCFPVYEMGGRELTSSDIEEMRTEFNDTADRILSTVNPAWSDTEKALYIHDYLASQCEYDTRAVTGGTDTELCRYDAYSLLVEGRSVCQGYALSYLYFMKRMGISCTTVPSNAMVHMWNQVQLDGTWYHVDITYDDPLNDIPGRANHSYFLLSDAAIKSDHRGWDESIACPDTAYDTSFWRNSTAPFVNDGDNWFYIDNLKTYAIYQWDPLTDKTAELAQKKVRLDAYRWPSAKTGAFLREKYSGLAIHGGIIYFNTPDEILCFPADADGEITAENLSSSDTDSPVSLSGSLFGIRIKNNVLEYTDGSSIMNGNENIIVASPAKPAYTFETPDATYQPPAAPTPPPTPASSSTQTPPDVSVTTPEPSITAPDEPGHTNTPDNTTPSGSTNNTGNLTPSGNTNTAANSSAASAANNTGSVQSPDAKNTASVSSEDGSIAQTQNILSAIKITAKKGKRNITIRVPKKTKAVISINKKILINNKKKYKKITVSAAKNKSGKLTLKLSSKLKKNMKISVTVYVAGKQYKKTVKV